MQRLVLCLLLTSALFCDSVILKTGVVVDGDILGKNEILLKIYVQEFNRPVAIERDKISVIVIDNDTVTFEQLLFKEQQQQQINPKFRPVPRRPERVKRLSMPVDTAKPKTDVFETARRENEDSTIKDIKKLNLLSNAPARWGSCGIGYYEVFNLDSDNPAKFKEYDFVYHGQPLDIRCLDAQIRRNFTSGRGTLLMDLGYGKRILQSDSLGSVVEAAMVRFVAVRYVLCMNRWLLSPGLSVGAMFLKAGVIRYTARRTDGTSMQDIQADLEMYDHTLRPLLGIDLNFYDVVAANVSMDLLATGNGRFHASLAFLMPFLQ